MEDENNPSATVTGEQLNTQEQPTACPFQVGDRVRNRHAQLQPDASVKEITAEGFKYEFDEPYVLGTRIGTTTGGTCFPLGYESWEKVGDGQPVPPTLLPCPWCAAVADAEDEWGSLIAHKQTCYWLNRIGGSIGRVRVLNSEKSAWNTRACISPPDEGFAREEIVQAITDTEEGRLIHLHWAEYFEAHPTEEKQYEATGEWDTAPIHRDWVAKYDRIIRLLGLLPFKAITQVSPPDAARLNEIQELRAENERLTEHVKDLNHDIQAGVNEANWQSSQGDEYGSY